MPAGLCGQLKYLISEEDAEELGRAFMSASTFSESHHSRFGGATSGPVGMTSS